MYRYMHINNNRPNFLDARGYAFRLIYQFSC